MREGLVFWLGHFASTANSVLVPRDWMSGLKTWTKDIAAIFCVNALLLYSVTVGERVHNLWSFMCVLWLCRVMIFNVSNKCSLWVFLGAWLHAGMITPWILVSTQSSLHLFKCLHSSHSLVAKCSQKKCCPPTIAKTVAKSFANCKGL